MMDKIIVIRIREGLNRVSITDNNGVVTVEGTYGWNVDKDKLHQALDLARTVLKETQ